MRLGIISDAHHYRNGQGQLCTLSPLARQFEQWATLFDEVTVCAPLLAGAIPATCTPYVASNINIIPVDQAGGNTLRAKLDLLWKAKGWWSAIRRLISNVDAIHIRCPNNISILGLFLLSRTKCLRQAVYTGSWKGYKGEPFTYRLQRWFLKNYFRGPVAVYGDWLDQPKHIVPSFSPSYSIADWQLESESVARKLNSLSKSQGTLATTVKLITIGALDKNKNQQLVIHAMNMLNQIGIRSDLDILGHGSMHQELVELAHALGVGSQVHFRGSVPHEEVRQFYREADFVVQAPLAEGYGKVPVEALFHGVIPILSDVGVSRDIVGGSERGRCFPSGDASEITEHIASLTKNPSEMIQLIRNGRTFAKSHTLEAWQEHIRTMLNEYWSLELRINPKSSTQKSQ